ncbi:MAG: phytanoyl-CoA dioxygenase family protein [Rhodospirillales bacterium]|nr:phytanoyl-CoA dioxygenase family protein [Rhodospirillales bacterium]
MATSDQTIGVSDEDIRQWRGDGVARLRSVIAPKWIEQLRLGAEQTHTNPGTLSKDYAAETSGSFFTDHAMFQRNDAIRNFIFSSPAAEIAARLMGSRRINLIDDHLLFKEPGTDNPTYWHQDQPYFQFGGWQFCSLWVPLDPVAEDNGGMRFVKGSHAWGKEFQPVRIGLGDTPDDAEILDGPVPDIDGAPDKYEILSWDLAPGDCLAFHGRMVHGARPNTSADKRRRALSLRFTGDDIRWQPRPYAPTDEGGPDLKAGDEITCEKYPEVWTAPV